MLFRFEWWVCGGWTPRLHFPQNVTEMNEGGFVKTENREPVSRRVSLDAVMSECTLKQCKLKIFTWNTPSIDTISRYERKV